MVPNDVNKEKRTFNDSNNNSSLSLNNEIPPSVQFRFQSTKAFTELIEAKFQSNYYTNAHELAPSLLAA